MKTAEQIVQSLVESARPVKPTQNQSVWWREGSEGGEDPFEGIYEVDGDPYREVAEAATRFALKILDVKIDCEVIFLNTLPESTGLALSKFDFDTGERAVILINRSQLDKVPKENSTAMRLSMLTNLGFHEARHIKQGETIRMYLRILAVANFMRWTYQTTRKEIQETQGIRIEESQKRIESWIEEKDHYISCGSDGYYAQATEVDARAFERALTKVIYGFEYDQLWPGEKRRITEFTKRYGEKTKELLPEFLPVARDFFLKGKQAEQEEAEKEAKTA